jgi:ferredoxin-NADP reductase
MQDEFEITVRLHGPVTQWLKMKRTTVGIELPLRGFGGDFVIDTSGDGLVPFIAGGVGITPLLGQLDSVDLAKLRLYWVIRKDDIGFVLDVFGRYPSLAKTAKVFFTGSDQMEESRLDAVSKLGSRIEMRRRGKEDFDEADGTFAKWYICAGNPLRARLLEWLEGRTVVFENFDY